MHCPALETDERDSPECLLISRFRNARLYCSKSTSLLSRKNTSATRAIAAIAPRYQPSVWMPKFMTRADAMAGANAPSVMAANRSMTGFAVSEVV